MSAIADAVKEARPNLSPSSVKTYASILGALHRKVFGNDVDLNNFKDSDKILEFLKTKPAAARKTVLSALFILTQMKIYRDAMMADVQVFNADMKKQEASPAQRAAAITPDELKGIYDKLAAEAAVLLRKSQRTVTDLLAIQDWVILALLGGIFIPPRRSLDYCAFKIKEINPETANHIFKNDLVFNTYKTAKTYGKQTVAIPKELKLILTKWIKINPTDWLLFGSQFRPLTSVKLNQRLNRIFGGRKIAINALRHAYLTSKYTAFSKEQKAMAEDMTRMGSSAGMLDTYVKLS